jgi:hypothetical protein
MGVVSQFDIFQEPRRLASGGVSFISNCSKVRTLRVLHLRDAASSRRGGFRS